MAKSKKQRKNRQKQIGSETRRDLIKRGMVAVVAGAIVKYLPSPKPTVAIGPATSITILGGKPTPRLDLYRRA